MSAEAAQARPGVEESLLLLDLAEKMVQAKDLRGLAEPFLGGIAALTGAPATVLFLKKTLYPWKLFSRWAWRLRRSRWSPAGARSA